MSDEKTPVLERVGLRYFASHSREAQNLGEDDPIHVLNPEERAALRRVERGVVFRACVVGAVSGVLAAVAEVLAVRSGLQPWGGSWEAVLRFWLIVGGVTGVATLLELAFLYWDSLRSVNELALACGLPVVDEDDESVTGPGAVAHALARAALELPNPPGPLFGVDPRREASRWRLITSAVVYKLKVSVTNFVLKTLVRRLLGRAAVRVWLAFVAVPVTAAWDGIVSWLVIREARLRVLGSSAAEEMARHALPDPEALSRPGQLEMLRAVAAAVVRTYDFHPNLAALMAAVRELVGDPLDAVLDDTDQFLVELAELDPEEQRTALRILAVAAVIDGKLSRGEKKLIREAHERCGRTPNFAAIQSLRRRFVRGDEIARMHVTMTVD